jgi:hypothetical protein
MAFRSSTVVFDNRARRPSTNAVASLSRAFAPRLTFEARSAAASCERSRPRSRFISASSRSRAPSEIASRRKRASSEDSFFSRPSSRPRYSATSRSHASAFSSGASISAVIIGTRPGSFSFAQTAAHTRASTSETRRRACAQNFRHTYFAGFAQGLPLPPHSIAADRMMIGSPHEQTPRPWITYVCFVRSRLPSRRSLSPTCTISNASTEMIGGTATFTRRRLSAMYSPQMCRDVSSSHTRPRSHRPPRGRRMPRRSRSTASS